MDQPDGGRHEPGRGHGPAAAQAGTGAPATSRPVIRHAQAAGAHPASPLAQAVAAARSSHRSVSVASATTQTSVTVAQPDGAVTSTQYVLPVQVRQHGRWAPVSAALRRTAGGRWGPAATPSGLTLSGGGRGPLAALASPAGGTKSVTFPAVLPPPVISGATATYHAVLPGTDLRVTATSLGGLSVEVIIRTAAAAARAALRRLRLPVRSTGLRLSADQAGNLTAAPPRGGPEFSGPAPVMWDSATARHPARDTAAAVSSVTGPGRSARVARAGLAEAGGALVITADAALLTPKAAYPVYLADSITPDTFTASSNSTESKQQGFVETQEGCNTAKNWDVSFTYGNGVGYQDYAPCEGLYRSYYLIDVTNLDPSMHVQSATLQTWENYSADWTCSDKWPLTLYWASNITSDTTWKNPPSIESGGDPVATNQVKSASNPNSNCSNQESNFDVTSIMAQAAAGSWHSWGFGLWGDENEVSTDYGFMRVGDNPDVITVFDLTPNVPTSLGTTPAAQSTPGGGPNPGCNQTSSSWGWIGQNNGIYLNAHISANITGEYVRAKFQVWDNQDSGNTLSWPVSNWYTISGDVGTSIGLTVQDGHQYGWTVASNVTGVPVNSDSGYSSADTPYCHFNVDLRPPAVPAISSSDFPPSGGGDYAGQAGSFTFTSSDPVPDPSSGPGVCDPAPCLASGVAYFQYSLNTPIPASGASQVAATTNSSGTATGTLSNFTVGDWGPNTLYVDAVDNAGNVSQAYAYTFYAPWNPASTVSPGDVDGDGIPDLLATTTSGGLDLYPGNSTSTLPAPVNATGNNQSPDYGNDWNTYLITHRGSMSAQHVDDLFAQKGSSLYIYRNSQGTSAQFGSVGNVTPVIKPSCTADADDSSDCSGYSSSWSSVSQILAPGDVEGTGVTDLLTVENGQLWIYEGRTGNQLLDPVLLGSSGWSGVTLIAPGAVNGQLTLWARDNSTGTLYSYPLRMDANNLPTLTASGAGAPVTATSGTVIAGISLPQSSYPAVASPGDAWTGSSSDNLLPSLYAVDTSGKVWDYPGISGSSPLSATPAQVGAVPAGHTIQQLS